MRLCRFAPDRLGVVAEGRVWDVTAALDMLPMRRWAFPAGDPVVANLAAIRASAAALVASGAPVHAVADVRLLSPVANPSKIVCAPVNYQAHLDEANADFEITLGKQAAPIDRAGLFLKAGSALIGPSEPIRLSFPDRRTDHEAEVAVVIGTVARNVAAAHALDYVAGYCLALDMTVRGSEDRSFRKSCDTYAVLGPWLVTADEVPDPGDLPFSLTVNGEPRQSSTTARLIRGIPHLIAWASSFYTLHPGDVIMTGTPEGVGPVAPRDTIRVEGGILGSMTATIAA